MTALDTGHDARLATGRDDSEREHRHHAGALVQPRAKRLRVVLYNPQAVFFTMPLALLAIGSELDPEVYEVVTIDGRLDRIRLQVELALAPEPAPPPQRAD